MDPTAKLEDILDAAVEIEKNTHRSGGRKRLSRARKHSSRTSSRTVEFIQGIEELLEWLNKGGTAPAVRRRGPTKYELI